ncbi:MAG: glycerol kinase GlpK [Gammaproteobacteria bacterium]|nr:glycerol kinase GlpK [Gammaproteobacteria bacterium]MCB1905080.1 glycerol kinase GlpK [Gammaproteobacteria bacterium]
MEERPLILSIDQGTTSSRAILFETNAQPAYTAQREFRQIFPDSGWVEHDPEEIWSTTLAVCREAIDWSRAEARTIAAIGITNQRETTVLWDRESGKPVYNAIVWQDRRTADFCTELKQAGQEPLVRGSTGLLIDPYFSGTKIRWILQNVAGAQALADQGRLAFGTTDSFLIWRLTGGKTHATDATNASRTMLFDIHRQCWDPQLLALLKIPESLLPEVKDSAADYGATDPAVIGLSLPICGVAGDQQAATIGQACFAPGMIKSTYGTGCFAVLNTGNKAVVSNHQLLTTVAYRIGGETCYALEGSIFVAGAAVQWLRDGIGIIQSAKQTEALAAVLDGNRGVYLVPAFTGLGAPYWDPHARGAIFGLTRDSGVAELVRATLESVAYQTRDLLQAMAADGVMLESLRVDGGMVANDWLLQFLADVIDVPVERPEVTETTALGAAYLAGLQQGIYGSLEEIASHWRRQALFRPTMDSGQRQRLLNGWDKAIERVRSK